MKLFDVYPRFDIEPVEGRGCTLRDADGVEYLDLYGGHAVISIGHAHPRFVAAISEQVTALPFYSNSVQSPIADRLATRLGEVSGCSDYDLFLCNSGAEAIENALKLASWKSGGDRVVAFSGGFHGRTSAAVAATDNRKIRAPINDVHDVTHLPINDPRPFERTIARGASTAAVLIEGVQGIGGIVEPTDAFLQEIAAICRDQKIPLILDEIQSGYGRTGHFFAHQRAGIEPDLITIAKGMGNGFPIGGLLIGSAYEARHGMLGTTFGGNHLACAAALAVLDVLEEERLMENASEIGSYLLERLPSIDGVTEVRGRGLMIGIDTRHPASDIRRALLERHRIFAGSASRPETIRLLPPLSLTRDDADRLLAALADVLSGTDTSGTDTSRTTTQSEASS